MLKEVKVRNNVQQIYVTNFPKDFDVIFLKKRKTENILINIFLFRDQIMNKHSSVTRNNRNQETKV